MADPAASLTLRRDYYAEPEAWAALVDLLRDTFAIDVSPIARFGGPDPSNLATAWFAPDGTCVANLTAIPLPLVINGRAVKAAGWQSGAVRPAFRGIGLYRQLMRDLLARCDDAGYEALVLYTDKPDLYRSSGFRVVPQHGFEGPAPQPSADLCGDVVVLDRADPATFTLLERLLSERAPVSDRLAVRGQARMILLNCAMKTDFELIHLTGRDVVVACRRNGPSFELLDVIGSTIPPLGDMLALLAPGAETISARIPTDRLGWEGRAVPDMGDVVLMIRGGGEFSPAEPACLSPLSEF